MEVVDKLEHEKAELLKENKALREKLKNCEKKIALLSTRSDSLTSKDTTMFLGSKNVTNPIFNHESLNPGKWKKQ
jgi:cell division septum initiation protein DivIVA